MLLSPRAYTVGNHVVIGDGIAGKHTLAHELTHVIQQRRGPVAGTDNGGGLKISDPSDRFEREAQANATRALTGPASVLWKPEGGMASGIGESAVQRGIDYTGANLRHSALALNQAVTEFCIAVSWGFSDLLLVAVEAVAHLTGAGPARAG